MRTDNGVCETTERLTHRQSGTLGARLSITRTIYGREGTNKCFTDLVLALSQIRPGLLKRKAVHLNVIPNTLHRSGRIAPRLTRSETHTPTEKGEAVVMFKPLPIIVMLRRSVADRGSGPARSLEIRSAVVEIDKQGRPSAHALLYRPRSRKTVEEKRDA